MFIRKLQIGGIVGGAFAVLAFLGSLMQGERLGEAFHMIPGSMLLGFLAVFWFTRNMDHDGNEVKPSTRQTVDNLQRELSRAVQNAAFADAKGDPLRAGQFRSQAAVIESQLRNLGA
jgi:hypothetical protein